MLVAVHTVMHRPYAFTAWQNVLPEQSIIDRIVELQCTVCICIIPGNLSNVSFSEIASNGVCLCTTQ